MLQEKAELIIEDAEIQSKNRINAARDEVKNIMKEYDHLKKEIFIFKIGMKLLLKHSLFLWKNSMRNTKNKGSNEILEETTIDEKS